MIKNKIHAYVMVTLVAMIIFFLLSIVELERSSAAYQQERAERIEVLNNMPLEELMSELRLSIEGIAKVLGATVDRADYSSREVKKHLPEYQRSSLSYFRGLLKDDDFWDNPDLEKARYLELQLLGMKIGWRQHCRTGWNMWYSTSTMPPEALVLKERLSQKG